MQEFKVLRHNPTNCLHFSNATFSCNSFILTDLNFVVFISNNRLYPVDKTRVNEYGQSFEEKKQAQKKKKQ